MFIILFPSTILAESNNDLAVHFIDVGQGDSILIQTPERKTILIDGGPPEGQSKLIKYLLKKHVEEIDLMIATHPDIDHIGGLIAVLNEFKVQEVIYPNKAYHTKTYKRFKTLLKKKNVKEKTIKSEYMLAIEDDVILQFMNTIPRKKKRTNNEASLVIKLMHEEVEFLFMADVGIKEEKYLMKQYDMRADILKVGHHGSKTSSAKHFLEAVEPKISIFTYGRDNNFGHPVKRVIDNLQGTETIIYATATHGHIEIKSDGLSYFILLEKSPLDELSVKTS